jgi:hypothetical protein
LGSRSCSSSRPSAISFPSNCGAPPFLLAYGSRDATPAAYAIETLVPGYGDGPRPGDARAGTRQTINVSGARAFEQQELGGAARLEEVIDWKRRSLWGSLVLGVLILGGMAWRLVRQMDSDGTSPPRDASRSE